MNGARYTYLEEICRMVEEGADIVIVSEDYAAPVFDQFRKKHPERFLNVGIAEQNGVAVACGLALAGKYPIVYGCAPFPLTRAIDQVKSAAAGMHLPMTILNSGIGFGVPEFGATHYNIDDLAMVRCIPGVQIITPSDNDAARKCARYSIAEKRPVYLRMDKHCEGELDHRAIDFSLGYDAVWSSEKPPLAVLVSCGYMVHECVRLAQRVDQDIPVKVLDLYKIPFDIGKLMCELGDLPVVTVEEHLIQGGIGSIILECMNLYQKKNDVYRFGVNFENGYPEVSGSREYFMKRFGLNMEQIEDTLRKMPCEGEKR